jgi:hypothetical protein
MRRLGSKVRVASDNDNENYDSFRNEVLVITYIAKNRNEHPGYDEGMGGERLYDLKVKRTGEDVGCSLYDYELEDI